MTGDRLTLTLLWLVILRLNFNYLIGFDHVHVRIEEDRLQTSTSARSYARHAGALPGENNCEEVRRLEADDVELQAEVRGLGPEPFYRGFWREESNSKTIRLLTAASGTGAWRGRSAYRIRGLEARC